MQKVRYFLGLDLNIDSPSRTGTEIPAAEYIQSSLRAQPAKLYHLGIHGNVSRNSLANANATRDWRIYASFAERLIAAVSCLVHEWLCREMVALPLHDGYIADVNGRSVIG